MLLDNVKWLSFHSVYDFGYLLSILTNLNLPDGETEFFENLKIYFPNIYDVKYLMKSCKNLKGGLQEVADMLEVFFFLFGYAAKRGRLAAISRKKVLDSNLEMDTINKVLITIFE